MAAHGLLDNVAVKEQADKGGADRSHSVTVQPDSLFRGEEDHPPQSRRGRKVVHPFAQGGVDTARFIARPEQHDQSGVHILAGRQRQRFKLAAQLFFEEVAEMVLHIDARSEQHAQQRPQYAQ